MHDVLHERSAQHVGTQFDSLCREDESGQEKRDAARRLSYYWKERLTASGR